MVGMFIITLKQRRLDVSLGRRVMFVDQDLGGFHQMIRPCDLSLYVFYQVEHPGL
jgi:hypothetical protein